MHYVDWAIGEFLSELSDAGLPEETIVALYGDHGASVDEEILALNQPFIENEINPFLNILGDKLDLNHIYYYRKLSRQVPWMIYEVSGTAIPVGIDSTVHSQVDIYRTANLFVFQ
jgi:phosphoglycerol transferase MdoB-like AlkP superfamily enzyme